MKLKLILYIVLLLSSFLLAQNTDLEGKVVNTKTGLAIEGANILVNKLNMGATSDIYGNFKLIGVPSDRITLLVSCVGFKTDTVQVSLNNDQNNKLLVSLHHSVITLGEAIVTSTKYQKQIKDVSLPLEIMSDKDINTLALVSVSDALDKKPGLTIARDGAWGTSINIRGLGNQNIVKLIDGNRIETATNIAAGMSLIDVNDIARIEVIKGAASSLYGSGALGGVVNIVTKGNRFQNGYYLKGSLSSSYNSVNNGGNGNIYLNAGDVNWFAKVSASIRSADNTDTPEGELANSQFKDNNISANLGFLPDENHEIDVKYQRFFAEDVGIPGGGPFPPPAKATYPEEKREMYSLEYKINNLLESMSNLSLKYFNQTIERRVELSPNPNVVVRPNADHVTNGIQVQTNWLFGKSNILIAGVDAWQRDYKGWRTREIIPQNQIVGETPVPDSDYRSIGFFVQDEMQIIENKLQLSLGGRIDQIKVTNEESFNPEYIIVNGVRNDSPPNKQKLWDAGEEDDISASANLGILYSINEQFDITLNVARSFRSPSLEERYQYIQLGAATYLGDPDLEPEKGTFLDLGIRIWDPQLSFTGNVFVNFLNDLVIDEYQSDVLYVKNNVGEARFYGFDFSTEYNFYGDYVVYAAGAYVRGEDTRNDVDLPQVPPLNGQLGVKFPVADYVNIDLLSTFYSDQNNAAQNEPKTTGYGRFDFYINSNPVHLGNINFRLSAGVENIFDKAYKNHLSTYRGLIKLEPGRNIFAKITIDF